MAEAELRWRHLELMLAHNRVEVLHRRCMPNHGRSQIRAVALHALHQPLPYADHLAPDGECAGAEERDVSGGNNKRPTYTIYSTTRDVDECWSLK